MGTYMYRRTAETPTVWQNGNPVKINIYRYFTKPHWDVWHYVLADKMPKCLDGWERQYVGRMRRKVGAQESLFYRMQNQGRLRQLVICLSEKETLAEAYQYNKEHGQDGIPLYFEEHPAVRMEDDPWTERTKVIGLLRPVNGKWVIV